MTKYQPSQHPAAKDLALDEPAAMDAKLAGYPWLPRIIDKARASQADTLGTYYRYPCPIDAAFLDLIGIDAHAFRDIAHRAVDDHAVIDELANLGIDPELLADFDPVQLNAELHRKDS